MIRAFYPETVGLEHLDVVRVETTVRAMQADPSSLSREAIVSRLRVILPDLSRHFGVRSLSVFGSRARETAGPSSDVDILVEFDRAPGFFRFVELEERLAAHLGLKVDLVMKSALRPNIGRRVLAEAIAV